MKYWHYAKDDQQFGPFTLEELKSKSLKKTTLVWTEGMDDWAIAETIDELKDIFVSEPPPLPFKSNIESIGTVGKKPSAASTKPDKNEYSDTKESNLLGRNERKAKFADEIYNFFRTFKLSISTALIFFVILYFVISKVYMTIGDDLSSSYTSARDNSSPQRFLTFYGNEFNKEAMAWYRKNRMVSYTTSDEFREVLSLAVKYYKIKKLEESILYSVIILLGLPVLISTFRITKLAFMDR